MKNSHSMAFLNDIYLFNINNKIYFIFLFNLICVILF